MGFLESVVQLAPAIQPIILSGTQLLKPVFAILGMDLFSVEELA
jgi:hypothetical protein